MLLVTLVWGATFVIVKDAVARMPVMDFLAWRFLAAALVMVAVHPTRLRRLDGPAVGHGVVLGLAIGGGYVAQTFGLAIGTRASVSGFLTGMAVVFTPLFAGVLLRRRIGALAWLAVAVATAGLALTSLRGVSFGLGELLTLGCAACFALHILGLSVWSRRYDSYALAVVQIGTVGVVCLAVAAGQGLAATTPHAHPQVWMALAVTAVLATAVGFLVQTWAQRHVSATRIAVVMTMEPVFAALAALLYGERLGWASAVGGAMVLAAMYLVELDPRRGPETEIAVHDLSEPPSGEPREP
ncbi:MAG: EamA family transporter [Streptosporangiales bacterium]|nr:EamA family transporter [Streptosporangiales bacterium]